MSILYYWCTNDATWAVTGVLVMLFGAGMLPAKLPQP